MWFQPTVATIYIYVCIYVTIVQNENEETEKIETRQA